MKLLLDENLSRKLTPLIDDLFPGSLHVSATGLQAATDQAIGNTLGKTASSS
jgi:predicted nuclease of predicted toxin-antitoxin system